MLTCRELTELVTDYLEGRLSFGKRVQFRMHVGMCRHCREYLRQMKQTIRMLGKLPDQAMPDDVRNELMHRFRNWKRSTGPI
jgi:predicted anti-sigma-YlaC factor YlaD